MRLTNRCYAITGLGYATPWCVNAGFIVGEMRTLVVDAGANTLAAQTVHGYARAVKRENQLLLINTEKHFDHIGGNGYFREQGIAIWGHAGIARIASEWENEITEWNAAIPNATRRELGEAKVFFHNTRLTNPNCPIHEDMQFDLGGCTAEVLLTPGHTPTNLSVWVPEDRVLFTGDCLIHQYLPNLDAGTTGDWQVWLASLQKLEALRPAVVVAGHGPVAQGDEVQIVFDTVRRILQESLARGYSPTAAIPTSSTER